MATNLRLSAEAAAALRDAARATGRSQQERLREAAKHGFTRALVPAANKPKQPIDGLEVVAVRRLADALDI